MPIRPRWRIIVAITTCALLAGLLAACGGSSSSSDSSSTAASPSTTDGSTTTATTSSPSSEPTLDELAARKQTLPSLPAVKVPPGQNIWVVSSSMEAPGSAYVANTVKEIMSERLSWNVTIFDGKGEPARYATGIQQALVAHADGIILVAVDCETAQPALESAKSANVPVVSLAGFDCPNDESLITAADFGGSAKAQYGSEGVALAEYVAAQTEGQAKAIVATEPDLQSTVTEFEEFKSTLTKLCPECEITAEAPALIADIANGSAAQKLSQVMLQNPDANVLVALQDAELEYISNALRTASQQLPVLAAGPLPTDPQMIENGSLQGVMAYDANMSMWVIVDNMVRLLAGTQAVVVPSVFTLMDKEHNLPASGGFVAPVDYEKAYLKSWGVK